MAGRPRLVLRVAWNICAATIIALAILVTGLRAILPRLDRDRAMVARWVSHVVGAPIEIHALEASFMGGVPTVTANGIRVLSAAAPATEVLRFEQAEAQLALWASLRSGQPRLAADRECFAIGFAAI